MDTYRPSKPSQRRGGVLLAGGGRGGDRDHPGLLFVQPTLPAAPTHLRESEKSFLLVSLLRTR